MMILSAHEIAKRLYESGCINDRPDGCIPERLPAVVMIPVHPMV